MRQQPWGCMRKNISKENSQCKSPEARACLVCVGMRSVGRGEWISRWVDENKDQEMMGAKLCGDFGYFSEMEILWNILTKKWYGFISLFKVHFGGGDENSVRKQRKDGKKIQILRLFQSSMYRGE